MTELTLMTLVFIINNKVDLVITTICYSYQYHQKGHRRTTMRYHDTQVWLKLKRLTT